MKAIHLLKTEAEIETELLALCRRKQGCDDELGRCSDHEGDDSGPTYAQFKEMPSEAYVQTLDYYVGEHEKAIRVIRRLMKLRLMEDLIKARGKSIPVSPRPKPRV